MTDTAAPSSAAFVWTRRHVLALTVLCLAALLDTIDVTVVNVAMPAIRDSLHFSESGLAWMVNAYLVPFGGFLLLGGRAGDLMIVPTSIAAMSGVTAARHGVASALLNVSRQLGGALGLAVISTVVASSTARSAAAGHGAQVGLTAGFHTGFIVAAVLVALSVVTAAGLLREEGRGEHVNLIELQAG